MHERKMGLSMQNWFICILLWLRLLHLLKGVNIIPLIWPQEWQALAIKHAYYSRGRNQAPWSPGKCWFIWTCGKILLFPPKKSISSPVITLVPLTTLSSSVFLNVCGYQLLPQESYALNASLGCSSPSFHTFLFMSPRLLLNEIHSFNRSQWQGHHRLCNVSAMHIANDNLGTSENFLCKL